MTAVAFCVLCTVAGLLFGWRFGYAGGHADGSLSDEGRRVWAPWPWSESWND